MSNTYQNPGVKEKAGYARPMIEIPDETYVPARDNPQENVRPGADDHKKHLSLPMQAQATYHRGHV